MNVIVQNLVVAFLAVNALFWGLMLHKVHCELFAYLSTMCITQRSHSNGFHCLFPAVVFCSVRDHVKRMMN